MNKIDREQPIMRVIPASLDELLEYHKALNLRLMDELAEARKQDRLNKSALAKANKLIADRAELLTGLPDKLRQIDLEGWGDPAITDLADAIADVMFPDIQRGLG